jgi:hypothetical protein
MMLAAPVAILFKAPGEWAAAVILFLGWGRIFAPRGPARRPDYGLGYRPGFRFSGSSRCLPNRQSADQRQLGYCPTYRTPTLRRTHFRRYPHPRKGKWLVHEPGMIKN